MPCREDDDRRKEWIDGCLAEVHPSLSLPSVAAGTRPCYSCCVVPATAFLHTPLHARGCVLNLHILSKEIGFRRHGCLSV